MNVRYLCEGALDGYPVAYFGLTYKNMMEHYREAVRILTPEIVSKSQTEGRIELRGGGRVEFWSFQSSAVNSSRGRKYWRVVLDEAAYIPDGENAWNGVIRPTLVDLRGTAMRTSTPNGKNHFHGWYLEGLGADNGDYYSWRFPSSDSPYINPAEIESIRISTPERYFKQEYLAEFLDDGGEVFRNVRACATAELLSAPTPGAEYVVGVDLAKLNDYTVFAIVDRKTRALVYLDRFNQIDYTLQLERLKALNAFWRPVNIIVERNVGEMFIEQAQRAGLPVQAYQTTNASKQTLIDGLAMAFEQRGIAIYPDPVLIAELESYAMEKLPSGLLRYGAPAGGHDDTVIALALAWHGCTVGGVRFVFQDADLYDDD